MNTPLLDRMERAVARHAPVDRSTVAPALIASVCIALAVLLMLGFAVFGGAQ